jgi:hypothetical protein
MCYRPKQGDEWEVKLPGKRKIVKIVGSVHRCWVQYWVGTISQQKRRPYVMWQRAPKGRYSGVTVKALIKYGKRLSTKAERDARAEARWQEICANRDRAATAARSGG